MQLSKHAYINLFHIFVVVPFLFYIYYQQQNKTLSDSLCRFLLYLGILGLISHIYLCYQKISTNQECWRCWVNYVHIFVVFPLFIYIGSNCTKTERRYFEILMVIAFAALGYHSMNFIRYR